MGAGRWVGGVRTHSWVVCRATNKAAGKASSPNPHIQPQIQPKTKKNTKLEEDWVRSNPRWVAELELMLRTRTKAEIQALSSFGFQYLSQVYLPLKLQEGDWI